VDIVTKSPTPILPQTLAFLYAYPPKYFKQVGADTFGQKPVGTGPYKFAEWVKGDYIKVKADPTFRGGAPKIDEITFRTAPEASTRVAMLETGRADIVMNVPPQMTDRVQKAGARVEVARTNRRVFVEYNRFDPILQDPRLRKAINYATDVDSIIKNLFTGRAYRATDILRLGMPGYAKDNVKGYSYDPAKAKELMAQAGRPNGFETDLYVGVGRLMLDKELAEALVGQWEKVGIKARLHPMEWAAFTTEAFKSDAGKGMMPGMHILSHAPIWWDADFTWQNHFWSKATWKYEHTPKGDQMFEEQRAEMDPKKRAALEQALEKYWVDEECGWNILYDQQDIYGVSKRLQWKPRPDELMTFQEAWLAE
jgi:peptide/nickel transport system substrate-binding protein